MNAAEISAIARSLRRRPLWNPGPGTAHIRYGRDVITRVLPHAGPAILLDEVTALDSTQRAICASRHLAPDDPVFTWHFPGDPVYPGALLAEAAGQTAGCAIRLLGTEMGPRGCLESPIRSRLIRVHRADFLETLRPGEQLTILARLLDIGSLTILFAGQVRREETVCMFCIAELLLLDD